MMTEDEARTKWCPMVRFGEDDACSNRWTVYPNLIQCRCIASDCMMWRFGPDKTVVGDRLGYCGLAGSN